MVLVKIRSMMLRIASVATEGESNRYSQYYEDLGCRNGLPLSDTAFVLMHVGVAMYNAMLDGKVARQEKAEIMRVNVLRLFGIAEQ